MVVEIRYELHDKSLHPCRIHINPPLRLSSIQDQLERPLASTTSLQESGENDEEDGQRSIYIHIHLLGPRRLLLATPGLRLRTTGAAAKTISTAPGQLCASDTEREADEPSRRLPTARLLCPQTPSSNDSPRSCSISPAVPAVVGTSTTSTTPTSRLHLWNA